jgi:CopG family transcriptional regulator/antitoxin EndoAI
MSAKVINISLPEELLGEIDEFARSEKRTRSELFREAARQYIESRRWRKIRDAGSRTTRELGLTEDDVERMIDEYRAGAAG